MITRNQTRDITYNIIATGFPGRIYPTTNSVITLCHEHESKYHQPLSTHPNVINEINKTRTYFNPTCRFVTAWIIPTGTT